MFSLAGRRLFPEAGKKKLHIQLLLMNENYIFQFQGIKNLDLGPDS
jgi:hypothetical protein